MKRDHEKPPARISRYIEPGLPVTQIFSCYGVTAENLHAWRSTSGRSASVLLELPDGQQLEQLVLLDEPVGGLQLVLHLDNPDLVPPPLATTIQFAGNEVPFSGSLSNEAVMEGSLVQLQIRDTDPVSVRLGTRDGERQVDLWSAEPLRTGITRALQRQLKSGEKASAHYFKIPHATAPPPPLRAPGHEVPPDTDEAAAEAEQDTNEPVAELPEGWHLEEHEHGAYYWNDDRRVSWTRPAAGEIDQPPPEVTAEQV